MKPGDKVRVYPEGGRAIAATGTIVAAQGIGSDRSIMVALPDRPKPAFATTQFHGAVLGVWIDEVWFRLIVLVRGQASIAGPGYYFTEIVSGDGFEAEEL